MAKAGAGAAIITIGSTVTQLLDFTSSKTDLAHSASLISLQSGPTDDDRTMLYESLVRAIDLDHRFDRQLPLRRAIVVLTDGVDDEMGGAGRQEVADKLAVDPVPIYMLAIAPPTNASACTGRATGCASHAAAAPQASELAWTAFNHGEFSCAWMVMPQFEIDHMPERSRIAHP